MPRKTNPTPKPKPAKKAWSKPVKAWGILFCGDLLPLAYPTKQLAKRFCSYECDLSQRTVLRKGYEIIPVLITPL